MDVESIAFDARKLVSDTVRFWQTEARKKNLRLRLVGARALPRWIEADPTRIRQVLNNLFSNALKFTEKGAVTLILAGDEQHLRFTVADDGVGMSIEQQGRLFTPFGQADKTVARTHGGTGLGLALSRDLARLMGGDLTGESTPGQGSRFTLSIPLRSAEPTAAQPEPEEEIDSGSLSDLRVLAVDDHEINRRAMGLLLETIGITATFAVDGEDALDQLNTSPFDLVLIDVHMPKIDGLEVARRLHAGSGMNRSIPLVAVTGATGAEDRARCLRAGMSGCVGKPIDPNELFEVLSQVLESAAAPETDSAKVA